MPRLLEAQLFPHDFGARLRDLSVKLRHLLFGYIDGKPYGIEPYLAEPALGLYFLDLPFRLRKALTQLRYPLLQPTRRASPSIASGLKLFGEEVFRKRIGYPLR